MKTKQWLFSATIIALTVVVAAVILLSTQPPTNQPPKTPATNSGEALYAQYCENCHHPLANSQKRGRSAEHIQFAIGARPQMKHLSNLTPAQIQAIAEALAIP